MDLFPEITALAEEFESSRQIMNALGDENRQHLILVMLRSGVQGGMRVNDIALQTHLSRPAVSHHLQILKKAGIVKMRRESTRNYYFLDGDPRIFNHLIQMFTRARDLVIKLPDRSGET